MTFWMMLKRTFSEWNRHEARRLGAALAFYALLSLAPLVILAIAVFALIFGHSEARKDLLTAVENTIGHQGSQVVNGMITHAQRHGSRTFASFIGVITLLFGASAVFNELRSALDKIWDVRPESTPGILGAIKQRFLSFGMVLAIGSLLLVSVVISTALAALGKLAGRSLPMPPSTMSVISFLASLIGVAVLFALVFRYVPGANIAWKSIWIGAGVTALLFTIGQFLIGLYLGKVAVGSAYGAAGSLVAVIVWVYYSSMIFLFGAEFTRVLDSGAP
ncbi:MAG: YihY/virulence factor BrkB family protein [Acidipila sp.]|nr:YihY/virulence factor BrkB family protein [Acidipila sp.]